MTFALKTCGMFQKLHLYQQLKVMVIPMERHAQLKNELSVYLVYLQLMTSLTPKYKGGIVNPDVKTGMIEATEFLKKANKEDILKKGAILKEMFQGAVTEYKKTFPPKVSLKQIAREFNEIYLKNHDIYSQGLEYGWLNRLMDCSNLGFPEDLPFHAKIGLGHHAGMGNIEEDFLLRDAFYLLILSEKAYENMHYYADYWEKSNEPDDPQLINEVLGVANQDVATYSRLCVLSYFSFVEVFVNSVGYDYCLKNQDKLNAKDIEILQGKKQGRYISLEYKIEKFPLITRPDKQSPLILSDSKQIQEPFKKFIYEVKLLRDSSVHYSPKKESIWRKPDEWLNKAKTTSKLCLDVARKFWKACYPNRKEPQYLYGLDYDKQVDIAKNRFKLQYMFNDEDVNSH